MREDFESLLWLLGVLAFMGFIIWFGTMIAGNFQVQHACEVSCSPQVGRIIYDTCSCKSENGWTNKP